MVALDRFFSFGRQRKWSLVALDRWSSGRVTIVREFAWVDPALVVMDEWPPYRGDRLNRFNLFTSYLTHCTKCCYYILTEKLEVF